MVVNSGQVSFLSLVVFVESNQLKLLLCFATGLDEVPPLGITPQPTLKFSHKDSFDCGDPRIGYPLANTCGNVLHIPVLDDYDDFKANFVAAIVNVQTFGNV